MPTAAGKKIVFSGLFWKSTRIPLGVRSVLRTICPRDVRSSCRAVLFAAQHNAKTWNAVGSNRRLATGWETAGSATRTKNVERWLVEYDRIHQRCEGNVEVGSSMSEW